MSDFSRLLRVEYGGFRCAVESVKIAESIERNSSGMPETYTRTWACEGELQADSQANLMNARDTMRNALYLNNQDLLIVAADSVSCENISAAVVKQQFGSGPSCDSLEWGDINPSGQRFKFVLSARRAWPLMTPQQIETQEETLEISTALDGQQTVVRSGRVNAQNASAIVAGMNFGIDSTVQSTRRIRRNNGDTRCDYEITILPLIAKFPLGVTDGELQTEEAADGLLVTKTAQGFYVGDGASQAAKDAGQDITSTDAELDSSRTTTVKHKQKRVDFQHVSRASANGDIKAVGWTERWKQPYSTSTTQVVNYPGAPPLYIVDNFAPLVYEHSGEILALDDFLDPPAPMLAEDLMLDPGEVTLEHDGHRGRRTSFRYTFGAVQLLDRTPDGPRPTGGGG